VHFATPVSSATMSTPPASRPATRSGPASSRHRPDTRPSSRRKTAWLIPIRHPQARLIQVE
jgi:hypothetical protein